MHLLSKFIEIEAVVHDMQVPDRHLDDSELVHDQFTYDHDGVTIDCAWLYTSGLHIMEMKYGTAKRLTYIWNSKKPHIRFFCYLKGHSRVKNGAGNENYDHQAGMLQRNFLDTDGGGGTMITDEDDSVHYVIIKMSLDFYLHLLKFEPWIMHDKFHKYIITKKPENRPNETLYMDIKMLDIIKEITDSRHIVKHRYHFLKLKLRELLFTIHQQTNYGTNIPEAASSVSQNMEKIKSYLILHLDNPPTSTELAQIFTLNEKKLKQDFKTKYSTTIYAFVVQMRMEKAKMLLQENYNVNELSILLGYHSVSHFIKIFKTHFGYTPKEFMKHFNSAQNTI